MERLLLSWSGHFKTIAGRDKFVSDLLDGRSIDSTMTSGEVAVYESEMKSRFPDMHIWRSVSEMYARRHAWRQIKAVVEFLSTVESQIKSSVEPSAENDMVKLSGIEVPVNVKADQSINQTYMRSLCSTGSYGVAFDAALLARRNGNLNLDTHLIIAFMNLISRPEYIPDSSLSEITDAGIAATIQAHKSSPAVNDPISLHENVAKTESTQAHSSSGPNYIINKLLFALCFRGIFSYACVLFGGSLLFR